MSHRSGKGLSVRNQKNDVHHSCPVLRVFIVSFCFFFLIVFPVQKSCFYYTSTTPVLYECLSYIDAQTASILLLEKWNKEWNSKIIKSVHSMAGPFFQSTARFLSFSKITFFVCPYFFNGQLWPVHLKASFYETLVIVKHSGVVMT